jgi:hypothetical protein
LAIGNLLTVLYDRLVWAERLVAVVAVAAVAVSGCSWLFVSTPPSVTPPPTVPLSCTESRAAPVLDTIVAVPYAAMAFAGAAVMTDSDDDVDEAIGTALLISGAIPALVYGLSAAYGYRHTRRCRDMKARQWQNSFQQPAPQRQGPTWDDPP